MLDEAHSGDGVGDIHDGFSKWRARYLSHYNLEIRSDKLVWRYEA